MSEPAVRPFAVADAARCGDIVGATPLWQRYGLGAERAAAMLAGAASAGDPVFVVEEDGRVEGFAWLMEKGAFGRGYLRLIAVSPERRGRGYGERLLAAVEARATAIAPDFYLLVSDFNVDAQRFYQRCGYVQVGRIPDMVAPGVAELIYVKRLR